MNSIFAHNWLTCHGTNYPPNLTSLIEDLQVSNVEGNRHRNIGKSHSTNYPPNLTNLIEDLQVSNVEGNRHGNIGKSRL